MTEETFTKVSRILTEVVGVEPELVLPEADLRDDLALDSLSMLQLLTSLEEEFERVVEDSEFNDLRTVNSVVSYIDKTLL
ncbi:acyl carrier protein [Streptomyces sp. R11]|uniref:Acyl carrier protein n=1 Tax=Streptomyces sp. R11 TaxID=3238625 RepID=A0AB39NDW9_9ACTN